MVVVTKDNFASLLPTLKEKLDECVYCAFDLEFSGLGNTRNRKDDTPEKRYAKMAPVASRYSIIQLGLTFFASVPGEPQRLQSSSFTFFLFPDYGRDDITLQPSSIKFLKQNNLDFGTWINKGLTFIDAKMELWEQERYTKTLAQIEASNPSAAAAPVAASGDGVGGEAAAAAAPASGVVLTRPSDVEYFERQKTNLEVFLAISGASSSSSSSSSSASSSSSEVFVFEPCNGFLRRALYEFMEKTHPSLVVRKTDDGNGLCVEMMSAEKREEHRQKLLAKAQTDLEASMGFRLFWNMLTKSSKPIVGHNCFFDLLYVMKNFDAPLADTLGALKERFESLFPAGIFDTKFVSDSGILGHLPPDDTSLASLYKSAVTERLGQSDAVVIHDAEFGVGGEESKQQLHDAGYDSFLTGSIFGQQLFKLGQEQIEALSKNRLFMMQSLFHMDLNSSNPEHGFIKIKDKKIYHLSAFAERTSTTDIIKPFTDAGLPLESLEVFWIDQVSTFVFFSEDLPTPLPPLPEGWVLKTYEEFIAPPPPPASASAEGEAEATGGEEAPAKKARTA